MPSKESSVIEPQVLASGLTFPELPRWHRSEVIARVYINNAGFDFPGGDFVPGAHRAGHPDGCAR